VLLCFCPLVIPFAYAGTGWLILTVGVWAIIAAVVIRRLLVGGPQKRDRHIV
jgi:hypothetical protein